MSQHIAGTCLGKHRLGHLDPVYNEADDPRPGGAKGIHLAECKAVYRPFVSAITLP